MLGNYLPTKNVLAMVSLPLFRSPVLLQEATKLMTNVSIDDLKSMWQDELAYQLPTALIGEP